MEDIKVYKTKDLVLQVNPNYDPAKLNLDEWECFLDKLCGDREYQKESIRNAIIFLASGRYKTTEDLVIENYKNNSELKNKYSSLEEYQKHIQLSGKLSANIDLATATGKSYVIYGIAQIMLGLGLVDKVLVLCPSLTIESGLTEKFETLSGSSRIKASIPESAKYKNPRIIDANSTIKDEDICIENIHAVYGRTGSSIEDSLKKQGERVLVLNDESHHIFNKVSGRGTEAQAIKKWKRFLLDKDYNFKYILGFTGTAYRENEYFNDVIYRYSLRGAIEDKIVKNIEYVQKDDSIGKNEKFQKIYQNHKENIDKYPKIKPSTILITRDISNAKNLREDLIDFLVKKEQIPREKVEEKVLIVTSANEHKINIPKLKTVDDKDDPTEWIVSVSMLTEGWDVKNVFQIVPWEDRAFNSKLLIAQVLGRGLRIPEKYPSPQPKVIVFNHDSWSRNIKGLVDEVLETETRIESRVLKESERAKYNFVVYNLDYEKEEVEVEHKRDRDVYDYSRIQKEGIKLTSQVEEAEKETIYETVGGSFEREKNYMIEYETYSIEEVLDKIYDEFEIRDWEGRILKLSKTEYIQNNLPPREIIKDIIVKSMRNVGIKGDRVVEKNKNKVLQAFATLLRKKGKTVVPQLKVNEPIKIPTNEMNKTSYSIGNFRTNTALFYSSNYEKELGEKNIFTLKKMLEENENSIRTEFNIHKENEFIFKTPLSILTVNGTPEFRFVKELFKTQNAEKIDSWVKSRDTGFYSIEYTWRKGGHQQSHSTFNPDFFIKIVKDKTEYIIIVETKSDKDDSDENIAKYEYANKHFERLNQKLKEKGINQQYIFHFLSPSSYTVFFEYLRDGRLIKGNFRAEIENLLEETKE
jgi:type III restriction enzyme